MHRSRKTLFAIGAATVTLAASAAIAVGQVIPNPPDGSPPGAAPPSNLKTYTCGPQQTSVVKTENSPSGTRSETFVPLPGANVQIVVPEGQTRCVKVLLTAETACEITAADDFCYVQALLDGAPMDPDGGGFQAMGSEDGTAESGAYEWIKRVGAGTHIVRIERSVLDSATRFWWDDWTFDVSLHL
jgi:hypothetical protein